MTHRLTLAAAVVAAVAVNLGAQDDRPVRSVEDAALQARINEAIHDGCAYLRRVQRSDGRWSYDRPGEPVSERRDPEDATGGLTALALYALAASGIPADDPAIVRGLEWVAANDRPFGPDSTYGAYSSSFLVLALTRIDAREHRRTIHRLATRLVEAQLPNGMWDYTLGDDRTSSGPAATGRLRIRQERPSPGDNSNTQFAVLALWSAQELAEFHVPRRTWERVQALYVRTQQSDGGWTYKELRTDDADPPGGRERGFVVTSTMTVAGLVSYVCATASLAGGSASLDRVRRTPVAVRGLDAFRRVPRDRAAFANHYFVYSVERVGTVLGLPDAEWYEGGARLLIDQQLDDGRFVARRGRDNRAGPSGHGDARQVYETALALLFLSRATARPTTPSGAGR